MPAKFQLMGAAANCCLNLEQGTQSLVALALLGIACGTALPLHVLEVKLAKCRQMVVSDTWQEQALSVHPCRARAQKDSLMRRHHLVWLHRPFLGLPTAALGQEVMLPPVMGVKLSKCRQMVVSDMCWVWAPLLQLCFALAHKESYHLERLFRLFLGLATAVLGGNVMQLPVLEVKQSKCRQMVVSDVCWLWAPLLQLCFALAHKERYHLERLFRLFLGLATAALGVDVMRLPMLEVKRSKCRQMVVYDKRHAHALLVQLCLARAHTDCQHLKWLYRPFLGLAAMGRLEASRFQWMVCDSAALLNAALVPLLHAALNKMLQLLVHLCLLLGVIECKTPCYLGDLCWLMAMPVQLPWSWSCCCREQAMCQLMVDDGISLAAAAPMVASPRSWDLWRACLSLCCHRAVVVPASMYRTMAASLTYLPSHLRWSLQS